MVASGYQPIDDANEAAMLDDIEASTRRLYQHSSLLEQESLRHVKLIDGAGEEMEGAITGLNDEARHAARARQNNTFWHLYLIILLETASLVVLLYEGL